MTRAALSPHRGHRFAQPAGLATACALCVLLGCQTTASRIENPRITHESPTSLTDIRALRQERREQVRQDIQQAYGQAVLAQAESPPFTARNDSTADRSTIVRASAEFTFSESNDDRPPDDPAAWEKALAEAIAEVAAGDEPAGLVRLQDLIERHDRAPMVVHAAAIRLLRINRADLIVERLMPVIQDLPADARLYQVLGLALYRTKRYPEAETVLLKSLELDNSLALTYLFLGSTAEKLQKPQDARRYFEKASKLGL